MEEQIVAEVNDVLAKHNYGLQPYIVYHETGAFPAVKLRKLQEKTTDASAMSGQPVEGDANLDAKIV